MVKSTLLFALAAAAVVAPASVSAQPAAPAPAAPAAGPVVCRAAATGETPNATMGTKQMYCRTIDMRRIRAAVQQIRQSEGTMNPTEKTQTEQSLAAFNEEFALPQIPGNFGGDQY